MAIKPSLDMVYFHYRIECMSYEKMLVFRNLSKKAVAEICSSCHSKWKLATILSKWYSNEEAFFIIHEEVPLLKPLIRHS